MTSKLTSSKDTKPLNNVISILVIIGIFTRLFSNIRDNRRQAALAPFLISKDNNSSTIETSKLRVSEEALKVRYQELNTHFRKAFDLYFKGTTILFTVIGVSLGYLVQASLKLTYARMICVCSLVALMLWYICNVGSIRFYKSITSGIRETSEDLGLKYDEGNYKIFKLIMFIAFGTFTPITLVMLYFLIYPPNF